MSALRRQEAHDTAMLDFRSALKCISATSVLALLGFGGVAPDVASAAVTYGTLSNFDAINDTGQPCNGFEIELEGLAPGDVVYTFGENPADPANPYIRYGKPTIVPNSTGTGTIVRYASPYDPVSKTFTKATPAAQSPYPVTLGHQCWTFGDPVNYPTSGCEHFGVSMTRNPTTTTYRWLVGDSSTGTLKVAGSPGNPSIPAPVNIPAPVWNVNQPPPPAPGLPPPPPIVIAVVQAPPAPPVPPGGKGQWGEAIWMKIFKIELPEPVALEDLVLGGAAVPDPDVEPPEIEWQLLQSPPVGKVGNWEQSDNGGEAGAGSDAVSRRYEFYKYTGQYDTDPDNLNEALCDNPTGGDSRCGEPDVNGVAGVGDLIGAQNAAVNLVPLCAVDVSDSISVKRSGFVFNFGTRLFYQKVTLTNIGAAPVFGPISLALDNLSANASLFNASGATSCTAPLGSQYVDSSVSTSAAALAPGTSVSVVLQFSDPTRTAIGYTTRVLATSGTK
ncbi:MAG TPA: hypothetical protein VFL90_13085 [Methylomirabilota bacterium]|nr:hypothetical protein [Methylomirabilota bacterium]